jgi:hypothetical protein
MNIIFWDMTPCSPLRVNRRFGGTCPLHLQGRPWRWRLYDPPKRRLTLNKLHGVMSQNMILFITNAVKTSNPTRLCTLVFFILHICLKKKLPEDDSVVLLSLLYYTHEDKKLCVFYETRVYITVFTTCLSWAARIRSTSSCLTELNDNFVNSLVSFKSHNISATLTGIMMNVRGLSGSVGKHKGPWNT